MMPSKMAVLMVGSRLQRGDVMRIGESALYPICPAGCICGYGAGGIVDEYGRWFRPEKRDT